MGNGALEHFQLDRFEIVALAMRVSGQTEKGLDISTKLSHSLALAHLHATAFPNNFVCAKTRLDDSNVFACKA